MGFSVTPAFGYEACAQLRTYPSLARMAIVGMSDSENFQKIWLQSGADAFVQKPKIDNTASITDAISAAISARKA